MIAGLVGIAVAGPVTTAALYTALIRAPTSIPKPAAVVVITGLPTPPVGNGAGAYYARSGLFTALAHYSSLSASLQAPGRTIPARIALFSGDFFGLTETPPLLGPEGVGLYLSYGTYLRLGPGVGAPGSKLLLRRAPITVAGVMPPGFRFPDSPDLWLLTSSAVRGAAPEESSAGPMGMSAWIARVAPTVPSGRISSAVAGLAAAEARDFPPVSTVAGISSTRGSKISEVSVTPLTELYGRYARSGLRLALGISGVLLLICVVSALAVGLVEAERRRTEVAIRQVMGATPRRILAEEFVRSCPPALAGGALALLLGTAALKLAANGLSNPGLPASGFVLGIAAWGEAACASLLIALLLAVLTVRGTAPGLGQLARQHALGGSVRLGLGRFVAPAQGALAAFLLAAGLGAGVRLFVALRTPRPMEARGVIAAALSIPGARQAATAGAIMASNSRAAATAARADALLLRLPSVASTAATSCLPFSCAVHSSVWIERPAWYGTFARAVFVSRDYFSTLGQTVLRGAWSANPDAIAISASLGKILQQQGVSDPVGSDLVVQQHGNHIFRITGVVSDVRFSDVEPASFPTIYMPIGQPVAIRIAAVSVIARGSGSPTLLAGARAVLAPEFSAVLTDGPARFSEILGRSLRPERLQWRWLGAACLLATFLTCAATYTLVAASAADRHRELAIRVALGATPARVASTVAASSLQGSVAGAAAGAAFWLATGQPLVAGVQIVWPGWALAAAAFGAVSAASLVAAAIPAWRAAAPHSLGVLREM